MFEISKNKIRFICVVLAGGLCAACNTFQEKPAITTFTGMCDASGAVPLSETRFVIADDEDNLLRVYDAGKGGDPLAVYDVSAQLGLFPKVPKNPQKPTKSPPELDIEAATVYEEKAYWITSHGRNSSGKYRAERLNFFATSLPAHDGQMQFIGSEYESLLEDLNNDPRFAGFNLSVAASLAPKEEGGLNIEGMTARTEGGVWIGFRNPVPQGKALLFALLNPEAVIAGQPARFGPPVLLDLKGRGIRALSWWRGQYLIAAGGYDNGGQSALYTWDGNSQPRVLELVVPDNFNPEAFFTPESGESIMVFSDEGARLVNGVECKKSKSPAQKSFYGVWLDGFELNAGD